MLCSNMPDPVLETQLTSVLTGPDGAAHVLYGPEKLARRSATFVDLYDIDLYGTRWLLVAVTSFDSDKVLLMFCSPESVAYTPKLVEATQSLFLICISIIFRNYAGVSFSRRSLQCLLPSVLWHLFGQQEGHSRPVKTGCGFVDGEENNWI